MSFPGGIGGVGSMPAAMNPNAGMSEQEQQMVKAMQMGMESCIGKTVMAGVMGGGLGAMFGLFMASVCIGMISISPNKREGKTDMYRCDTILPCHNPSPSTRRLPSLQPQLLAQQQQQQQAQSHP